MNPELFHHNKQAYEKLLSSNDLLQQICTPLFASTKFKTFIRGRFLLDEAQQCTKVIIFFTNLSVAEWAIYQVLKNDNQLNEAAQNASSKEYSYFCCAPTDALLGIYKENFGLCNGMLVYKRAKDYIDFWEFHMHTSTACGLSLSNTFLQEIHRWINYFEDVFGADHIQNGPVKYFSVPHDYGYRPQQIFQDLPFREDTYDGALKRLSSRERECFQWIGKGRTMKEIAQELGIKPRTVETHINHIKAKTGLNFKSDLIKLAQENRWF